MTHYCAAQNKSPSAEGLFLKGTVPSFTLTRKPLFYLLFTAGFLIDCIGPSLLVETDFGQHVAVNINACFMQKNMILVAFKEFRHCTCIFVELLLDL